MVERKIVPKDADTPSLIYHGPQGICMKSDFARLTKVRGICQEQQYSLYVGVGARLVAYLEAVPEQVGRAAEVGLRIDLVLGVSLGARMRPSACVGIGNNYISRRVVLAYVCQYRIECFTGGVMAAESRCDYS
jgi:hypothetical protein